MKLAPSSRNLGIVSAFLIAVVVLPLILNLRGSRRKGTQKQSYLPLLSNSCSASSLRNIGGSPVPLAIQSDTEKVLFSGAVKPATFMNMK